MRQIKIFFLVIVLQQLLVPGLAQSTRFSLYADPQVNWLRPDGDASGEGITTGFIGGLGIDRYFTTNYAFSTGIFIEHTGGRLSYGDSIPVQTEEGLDSLPAGVVLKYNVQYLSVPLGLRFTTDEIGYLTIFARIGLRPQFRLKADGRSDHDPLNGVGIKDEVNLFSLGYYFGGGIQYSLGGNTSVILGVTYFNGLLDTTTRTEEQVRLNSLGIQIGMQF